ncbi:MBL fold metallo-hydrolase [Paenibacillus sp. MMS20-IR301]|uniref:MBL fold metallo-hydrolase n=1 Tax=Paenibacillus sp. MMS20-IR301 TaxID=2895946 RepID=UPI0028EE1FD1|nr:MBL fold metallo-hydrolase [Paenibacillus sp. MMS20-IR301]WNS46038.1 MBL fold metallo-hydrolase [Paenibacillus sp. MMS20-IR301]
MNYYSAEKISRHVTRITSMSKEYMYLIEGEREAVLVDTCLGVGSLRAFVESLTSKPLTVLLTHGHVDHAMGAPEFAKVYMNLADVAVYLEHQALQVRQEYMAMTLGLELAEIRKLDFVQPELPDFLALRDGDRFDLGGVQLAVSAAAGHTPGTMAVLIEEERTLILGDAGNRSTFLFDKHSSSVESYRNSMISLASKTAGKFDQVYLCHHLGEAPALILEELVNLCGEIMDRQTDDIPFEFMEYTACIAKAVDENFNRLDGGTGNIIYDVNKIFNSH